MLLQGKLCTEEESRVHDELCFEINSKLQAASKRRSNAESPVIQLHGPRQYDILSSESLGSCHHVLGFGHNYHGAKTGSPI